jgi:hypothetical protein
MHGELILDGDLVIADVDGLKGSALAVRHNDSRSWLRNNRLQEAFNALAAVTATWSATSTEPGMPKPDNSDDKYSRW